MFTDTAESAQMNNPNQDSLVRKHLTNADEGKAVRNKRQNVEF